MSPAIPKAEHASSGARSGASGDAPDRYEGFSLRSVTWGYRDIFEKAIEELFEEGFLGPQRREVTSRFFELLKHADQSCFDHVLRQFIGALNPRTRWIMDLPAIFNDVVETGAALAGNKLYNGMRFFETLAAGGMGSSPERIIECLNWLHRLREIDDGLAMAFLSGYEQLSARLRPIEIERYLESGLQIYRGNREAGCSFLRGELSTSETYILALTRECRLCDVSELLRRMIAALTGMTCEVADLGQLDSDDLIERGTRLVSVEGHIYLPARFRHFESSVLNRRWYILCGIVSAAMIMESSFPRIHGHPRHRDCTSLVGGDIWRINLFQMIEYSRVLRRAVRRWPGLMRMIAWGVDTEIHAVESDRGAMRFFSDVLGDCWNGPVIEAFRTLADDCVNCFDAARRLDEPWVADVLADYPALKSEAFQPVGFLSDFMFPLSIAEPPSDQLIADLKDAASRKVEGERKDEDPRASCEMDGAQSDSPGKDEAGEPGHEAVFTYDEWDFQQNDYHADWCHVHQKSVQSSGGVHPAEAWMNEARKIRAVFERLKPDIARREKNLADGDYINADLLIEHIVNREREPSPPARFYEKPIINHRDLAALVLLDLSGSTGAQSGESSKVLDIEKQACILLGQGLAALDDRFAVCGFSSNGREKCEYLVFKGFEDAWGGETVGRVMAAWPRSSTRIGPALRHSGYLLSSHPSRQRLILLVTDGQPMDQGYDPDSRYAQHDVRMACEENMRNGIHTFAISTEQNSLADMEIMFPRRRFAIISDIHRLSVVLPRLYIQMTVR